jgi:hypothetical protein
MKVSFRFFMASVAIVSFVSCSKDYHSIPNQPGYISSQKDNKKPEAIVFRAAGDIDSALSHFRDLLGTLNTAPGAGPGRREINWDGVPTAFTNNFLFPGDFFGASDPALPNARKRGLISTTPGTGFSISDSDFLFINPTYPDQFNAFSLPKTFIPVGSNITDNFFKIPGTNTDATVQGFGVIFSDVDNASSTYMEYYNGDKLLGSFKVPNNGNNHPGAFSFLGVFFPNDKVTRVRIFSGSAPLSARQNDISDGGGEDLVVMDDFIYSEPQN